MRGQEDVFVYGIVLGLVLKSTLLLTVVRRLLTYDRGGQTAVRQLHAAL